MNPAACYWWWWTEEVYNIMQFDFAKTVIPLVFFVGLPLSQSMKPIIAYIRPIVNLEVSHKYGKKAKLFIYIYIPKFDVYISVWFLVD